MTIRSFVALPVSEGLREELKTVLHQLRLARADVKWVEAANLHLTLKFLGDVREDDLEKLVALIDGACRGLRPLSSSLTGLGAFPDLHHPKIVWLGLDDADQKIQAVAGKLESGLIQMGFDRDEHPFRPHITLGRVRSSSHLKDLIQGIQQVSFEGTRKHVFDKIVLYKSSLTPQGAVYEILKEFQL